MHIPFYHDIGHGLHWGTETLRWVSLRRAGGTVVPVGTWETSIDGDLEAALAKLVDTVAPDPGVVATHVDPAHVMMQVEPLDVHANVERWTEEQVERMLPPGVPRDDFCARTLPLGTGDPPRVLVAVVRRDAVAARIERLQGAGLTPTVIGDLRLGLGFAYAFDPEFSAAEADLFLSHGRRGWRLRFDQGQLAAAPETWPAFSDGGLDDLLAVSDGSGPVFLAGRSVPVHREDGASGQLPGVELPQKQSLTETEASDRIRTGAVYVDDGPDERGERHERGERYDAIRIGGWADLLGFDTDTGSPPSVAAPFVPAAAMAMQQLYGGAAPLNVLDEATADAGRDLRDRREALRLGLAVSLVVGGLLLVSTLAQLALAVWTQSVQEDLTRMQAELETVEAAERRRDALRDRLRQSRRLVQRRTHAAVLLERVGRSVPEEVWLDGVAIGYGAAEDNESLHRARTQRPSFNRPSFNRRAPERRRDDAPSSGDRAASAHAFVRVTGFAPEDRPIASFLGALERREALSRVRLVAAHQLRGDDVLQGDDVRRSGSIRRLERGGDAAHRFDIRLEYRP